MTVTDINSSRLVASCQALTGSLTPCHDITVRSTWAGSSSSSCTLIKDPAAQQQQQQPLPPHKSRTVTANDAPNSSESQLRPDHLHEGTALLGVAAAAWLDRLVVFVTPWPSQPAVVLSEYRCPDVSPPVAWTALAGAGHSRDTYRLLSTQQCSACGASYMTCTSCDGQMSSRSAALVAALSGSFRVLYVLVSPSRQSV